MCIRYGLRLLDTACVYKVRLVFMRYGLCALGMACVYQVRI